MTEEQWSVYKRVIAGAHAAGIPFSVGGGLAIGVYTGLWRETKDMDIYVLPENAERMKEVLSQAGLRDYFDQLPYDRAWIYRSFRDKVIVDVIWAMANYKCDVDERWISGGPAVTIRDETFRIVPAEEMIWAKLYVLQKDRTDWPDVLNMIYTRRRNLDWSHLIKRLGKDAPLLGAALMVFGWLSPDLKQELPASIWKELEDASPSDSEEEVAHRTELLDRRPWFHFADKR